MALFLDYIRSLQDSLHNLEHPSELCVVSGNESCDLDSIVSALMYAHYISANHSRRSDADLKDDRNSIVLPLLQCRRDDFFARQDATMLMEELGIDVSSLVFLDDVTTDELSAVDKLSVVLVDHHSPTGILASFSSRVTRIIDHHEVESSSLGNKDDVVVILELTGSCTTLIAREILKDHSFVMEEPIARALVSVILLDTSNLLAEGRVTNTDSTIVEDLLKFLPSSFDKDEQFSKYLSALVDVSSLSIKSALAKDFKESKFGARYKVGFSSLMLLLSDYLVQPKAKQDLAEFFSVQDLDALIVFGVSIPAPNCGEVRKQIAVYQPEGSPSEFTESLVLMFEANEELKCERMEDLVAFEGVVLDQGNVELSRKQIIPILASFIASVEVENPEPEQLQRGEETIVAAEASGSPSGEPFPLEPTINIVSNTVEDMATLSSSGGDYGGRGGVESAASRESAVIPEYSREEESKDRRAYLFVSVGGEETIISMGMVEPYKKIIQHAGYIGDSRQALVVISACHLPPRSLPNHSHVLHHTFYYLLSVLDKIIVDNYIIIYLHSGAPSRSMPSLPMLHKFYRMLDRRLRKQLSQLFIVHPTFWVKTMFRLARPILSKKFWAKLHFIPTLEDLSAHMKLGEAYIAGSVLSADQNIKTKRLSGSRHKSIDAAEGQSSTLGKVSGGDSEPEGTASKVSGGDSEPEGTASNTEESSPADVKKEAVEETA